MRHKYISRIVRNEKKFWRVRIPFLKFERNFSDSKHGGPEATLQKAIALRNAKLEAAAKAQGRNGQKAPPVLRKGNNTGIPGVVLRIERNRICASASFTKNGKTKRCVRCITPKYTAYNALKAAAKWRFKKTKDTEIVFTIKMVDFNRIGEWLDRNSAAEAIAVRLQDELLLSSLARYRAAA